MVRQKISVRSIYKKIVRRNNEGVALILTLLILLTLVVLGLALLLQTDTEYLIAVNEQDSIEAFHHAEAGLTWAKRTILDIAEPDAFTDFSVFLKGPDGTAGNADDNLVGLKTIDTGLVGTGALNNTNEVATSVIVNMNFGDGTKSYEAFRMGINEDGDTDYDNPRSLIYVRVDDNYDEAPATNDPLTDTDRTIILTVVSEYPVFADDATGAPTPGTRSMARRQLKAKFGPGSQLPAIVTDRSLKIGGNPIICGECGSIHANGEITNAGGDVKICKDFTATGDNDHQVSGTIVLGDFEGDVDPIEVPIINPYDEELVPEITDFNGSAFFKDPPTNSAPCDQSTPKYFALVGNTSKGLVSKAYWQTDHWKWRLIDDLNEGGNTMLDDCGRVVCGTVNGTNVSDPEALGDDDNQCDAGEAWVNDDKEDEFYGWKLDSPFTQFQDCPPLGDPEGDDDKTLCNTCDINKNDYNITNYRNFADTVVTTHRLLPGSFEPDNVRDFPHQRIEKEKARWDYTTDKLSFSPTFNAVFFVFSNIKIDGNPGESDARICTSASSGRSTKSMPRKCEMSDSPLLSTEVPPGYYRASFIAVSSIVIGGNPKYSTARPEFPFLLIAGRDIEISGNGTGSETVCTSSSDPCEVNLGNSAELAGIIAAHEQVRFSGNPSLDGFVIIEDAANCEEVIQRETSPSSRPLDLGSNFSIHYDCINPPNPWASKVKLNSWQEVQ